MRGSRNDCFWHEADLPRCPLSVRFRTQSGHQPAIGEQSRFMSTRPSAPGAREQTVENCSGAR
jgi:hypothetical protein